MDTQEYERLANKYLDSIYRVAVNGCQNYADAEDMADGYATGNFERNGFLCQYEVKEEPGVPGCYEIHIFEDEKNDL